VSPQGKGSLGLKKKLPGLVVTATVFRKGLQPWIKKEGDLFSHPLLRSCKDLKLFGFYSADRANCSARTAINAFVWIYNINVTGRNGFYGTFIDTSATCSAVFGNFVCHDKLTVISK
jgi:hypothetical protein